MMIAFTDKQVYKMLEFAFDSGYKAREILGSGAWVVRRRIL